MHRRFDWRVHLVLLFVQVAFGGFHVIGKAVLSHLDPLAVAGIRVIGATPLLFLMAWWLERALPTLRDLPTLAVLGLLGVFLNQILFIIGLQYTTATNAGILMPSIPVFTAAIAALFGVERLDKGQAVGIALAVAGAMVMLNPFGFAMTRSTMFGNLLIILNCLSYAGYLVLQRPILRRLPPLTVTAWSFLFGGLGVVAVSFSSLLNLSITAVPALVWWGLLYIVLIPTALNYALNTWAVGRSSPSLAAAYIPLQPVAAGLLAALFLGESAGWREAMGFVLIVAGLFLVSRGMNRRRMQNHEARYKIEKQLKGND